MRINTSLKYRDAFREIIIRLYRDCIRCHWTHGELLDHTTTRLYNHPDWKRVPAWVRRDAHSYRDALVGIIWRDYIHWRVCLDGELLLGKDVPKGEWHRVTVGNHVWNDDASKLWTVPSND